MKLRHDQDLTGRKFNRWTVLHRIGTGSITLQTRWHCKCSCGTEKQVRGYSFIIGNSKSCGCYTIERIKKATTKHGLSSTPEYEAYTAIIQRCTNPKNPAYKYYGARGIQICKKWRESFQAFLNDTGKRPSPKHSIDRINNNGDYEPGNIRWTDHRTQMNNTRSSKRYLYKNKLYSIKELYSLTKPPVCIETLYHRIKNNWPIEKAIAANRNERLKTVLKQTTIFR